MTLYKKISLSAAMIICLCCGGILLFSLSSSVSMVEQHVEQSVRTNISAYNAYIDNWLNTKKRLLGAFPSGGEETYVYLQQLRDSGNFENVFLAFPDGSQKNANRDILPEKNNDPRQWGWYINALKNKPKVYIDNPSIAAATNTHVVSMGRVISYNGTPAIIGADVDIQDVLRQLTNVELPGDGYIFVLGKNDTIFAHEDSSLLNQNAQSILDKSQLSLMLENPELQRLTTVDMGGDEYYISIVPLKNDGLKTVAIISKSSVLGSTYETLMILTVGATTAIILFIYIFSQWCRFLFSPLREVTSQLQRIGAGTADLSVKINMVSQDEVGQLAASFNAFTSKLAGLLKEIDQKTARLFDYAETSSKSASTINQRLEAQQIETSQVAVATKELTCATQEISSLVSRTSDAVKEAEALGEQGLTVVEDNTQAVEGLSAQVNRTVDAINNLGQHVNKISIILGGIKDIAEQTNLLALNAAIEAARAGEKGRGFAVVADEVRVLSQKTSSSTEEITNLLRELQSTTDNVLTLIQSSHHAADKTINSSQGAIMAIEQLHGAVSQISTMSLQIAVATEQQTQVTRTIEQNISTINEVATLISGESDGSLQHAESLKVLAAALKENTAALAG